jgi:hypothetical protein
MVFILLHLDKPPKKLSSTGMLKTMILVYSRYYNDKDIISKIVQILNINEYVNRIQLTKVSMLKISTILRKLIWQIP